MARALASSAIVASAWAPPNAQSWPTLATKSFVCNLVDMMPVVAMLVAMATEAVVGVVPVVQRILLLLRLVSLRPQIRRLLRMLPVANTSLHLLFLPLPLPPIQPLAFQAVLLLLLKVPTHLMMLASIQVQSLPGMGMTRDRFYLTLTTQLFPTLVVYCLVCLVYLV